MENSIKGISAINPANMEIMESLTDKAHAKAKMGVLLDYGYSMLRFQQLQILWVTFHAKNRVRSASVSTAFSLKP